jgi:hypothetical protein
MPPKIPAQALIFVLESSIPFFELAEGYQLLPILMIVLIIGSKNCMDIVEERTPLVREWIHLRVLSDSTEVIHKHVHIDGGLLFYVLPV